MPWIAFVDDKLYEKVKKISDNDNQIQEEYPEQEFIASCLRVGLTIKDLEELTYIEAMKVLYSFLEKKSTKKPNERIATQADIDNLLMWEG